MPHRAIAGRCAPDPRAHRRRRRWPAGDCHRRPWRRGRRACRRAGARAACRRWPGRARRCRPRRGWRPPGAAVRRAPPARTAASRRSMRRGSLAGSAPSDPESRAWALRPTRRLRPVTVSRSGDQAIAAGDSRTTRVPLTTASSCVEGRVGRVRHRLAQRALRVERTGDGARPRWEPARAAGPARGRQLRAIRGAPPPDRRTARACRGRPARRRPARAPTPRPEAGGRPARTSPASVRRPCHRLRRAVRRAWRPHAGMPGCPRPAPRAARTPRPAPATRTCAPARRGRWPWPRTGHRRARPRRRNRRPAAASAPAVPRRVSMRSASRVAVSAASTMPARKARRLHVARAERGMRRPGVQLSRSRAGPRRAVPRRFGELLGQRGARVLRERVDGRQVVDTQPGAAPDRRVVRAGVEPSAQGARRVTRPRAPRPGGARATRHLAAHPHRSSPRARGRPRRGAARSTHRRRAPRATRVRAPRPAAGRRCPIRESPGASAARSRGCRSPRRGRHRSSARPDDSPRRRRQARRHRLRVHDPQRRAHVDAPTRRDARRRSTTRPPA